MNQAPFNKHAHLPYKSIAIGLLFSAILGPVGLLYASFWGGLCMITLAIFVISNKFIFLTVVIWLLSCIWSVRAIEAYNKKILAKQY